MESIEPRRGELHLLDLRNEVRAVAASGEELIITDAGEEIAVILGMADYERLHEHADAVEASQVEVQRVQSQIDDNRSNPERRRPRPRRRVTDALDALAAAPSDKRDDAWRRGSSMSPDQPPTRHFIRRDELLRIFEGVQVDPGLRQDIYSKLAGDTTDDDLDGLYERYATHIRPLITRTSDDRWRAQYPGVDWYVVADSEEAAGDEILKEALRRVDAGESDAQPPHDLLKRHLTQPIPGVYVLDRELFVYLRSHAGVAETQLAFEESERRRAAGQSYTMDDYLKENRPQNED